MMGGMGGFGGSGGFGAFGLIGMLVNLLVTVGVIVGVVLLVVWLVRRSGASGLTASNFSGPASAPTSPREILQVRYARGEITRDQYQQALADLS